MLRKRNRSHQKHLMVSGSDPYPGQSESSRLKNQRNGSIFSIPSLFVAFSNKGSSENDSAWSPTSPLDFRLFSGFRNTFAGSSKSAHHVHQKSWDSSRVGLGIVDSLDDASGNVLRSSESKNILFGPGMKFGNLIYPNDVRKEHGLNRTLKDYPLFPRSLSKPPAKDGEKPGPVFENGDNSMIKQDPFRSWGSYRAMASSSQRTRTSSSARDTGVGNHTPPLTSFPLKPSLDCSSRDMDPVSEREVGLKLELSEGYTRVISRGPNPKTTHFYGDHILESLSNNDLNKGFSFKEQKDFTTAAMPVTKPAEGFPHENFLSLCNSCNKDLQGDDIYMYRGYIAFCSEECRSKGIMADEKTDEAALAAKSVVSDKGS